jgi:hypothetical protein
MTGKWSEGADVVQSRPSGEADACTVSQGETSSCWRKPALLPHKERYPPPLKSQNMQHLRKQVIRSFKIEDGVHNLLQRQPIKNGEQESSQDRWIER